MTGAADWLWYVIGFLLVIGPLIFIHELGHYFVARWFGVKAEVFSIGFGREIGGWTDRRGTRWKLCWLPIGGYVRFAGDMSPASEPSKEWLSLPPEERARTFQAKPLWQRFLIVLAGPMTNILLAIAILSGFILAYGQPQTPPIVAAIKPGSAAAEAQLRPGDRILSVDGTRIEHFDDIAPLVILHPGEPLELSFERAGRVHRIEIAPKAEVEKDQFGNEFRKGLLGIQRTERTELAPVPLLQVIPTAVGQTWRIITLSLEGVGQIITGKRSIEELGGPLKIAKFSGEQTSLGLINYISFVALISINLGFINLLPIPLLDGGHLLFYMIEGIRRKPLRPEAQEWAFRTGLAALLALMIFVTLNDLASFGLWSKLGGLIG
jgi:regulator of sigma E protease